MSAHYHTPLPGTERRRATRTETIPVTPEMIEAGFRAFLDSEDRMHPEGCLPAIYRAMRALEPALK
jgi:hypothetical protein